MLRPFQLPPPPKKLETFHPFQQLPFEIRTQIYECILPEGRNVYIPIKHDRAKDLQRHPPVPVILHLNYEARKFALKHFFLLRQMFEDFLYSQYFAEPCRSPRLSRAVENALIKKKLEKVSRYRLIPEFQNFKARLPTYFQLARDNVVFKSPDVLLNIKPPRPATAQLFQLYRLTAPLPRWPIMYSIPKILSMKAPYTMTMITHVQVIYPFVFQKAQPNGPQRTILYYDLRLNELMHFKNLQVFEYLGEGLPSEEVLHSVGESRASIVGKIQRGLKVPSCRCGYRSSGSVSEHHVLRLWSGL